MKVAICFFGFLRQFKITNSSIIEKLIKPFDVDVFMYTPHTYFNSTSDDPHFSVENPDKVEEEYIKSVFGENLKNFVYCEHLPDHFKQEVRKSGLAEANFMGQITWRTFSMFHMIQNTIKLKKEYEKNNNFKYDAVILMRPDLELLKYPELNELDLSKVSYSISHAAPVYNYNIKFGDHMMISNSDNIDLFEELYDKIPEYCLGGLTINNETILGYQLIKNKIESEATDLFLHKLIR